MRAGGDRVPALEPQDPAPEQQHRKQGEAGDQQQIAWRERGAPHLREPGGGDVDQTDLPAGPVGPLQLPQAVDPRPAQEFHCHGIAVHRRLDNQVGGFKTKPDRHVGLATDLQCAGHGCCTRAALHPCPQNPQNSRCP